VGVDREKVSNAARERAKAGREGAAAGGAGGDARRHWGKIVEKEEDRGSGFGRKKNGDLFVKR
jgi:hypothetical protein